MDFTSDRYGIGFEKFEPEETDELETAPADEAPLAGTFGVDLWVVSMPPAARPDLLFLTEEDVEEVAPLRICRRMDDTGQVTLGGADPESARRMSCLLLRTSFGEA